MNLLDSILCTTKANKYASNFEKYGVDVYTLKILNDEDLQIIGVEDEEVRQSLLEHMKNLQIASEQWTDIVIDSEYIELVLSQLSQQLNRHLGNLTIPLVRGDVVICNVHLKPAIRILHNCISTLEDKLKHLKEQINPTPVVAVRKPGFGLRHLTIPLLIISTISIILIYKRAGSLK